MISADFYPTQQTQFTVEYTDVINNLTYDDPETMAEPYYMGYVKWDDVPTMQHMSKLNVVTGIEEAYVEFADVTQTENVPWFFTGRYSTSSSSGSGIYIADESTNKYVHPTLGNHFNYGFFNSLEIQRVGSYGSFQLYVFYNIINPSTTPPTISQGASYLQYNSTNISFEDFLKWMNGEIQLSISITIGAVQENIYFDFADFLTGECEKEHTNGELQVWLVDVFTPYNARDYQPNNVLAQWSNQNATLKLHVDIDGDIKPFLTNGLYWHTGYSDERYIRLDNAQTLSHYVSGYNGYVMGGFNGRIPYTFFAYGLAGRYYVFGNMIVWKYTSSQTRIARIIPITDIVHFLAPFATRISTTGVNPAYGYADTIEYPLFNDDNSPKWEYETGLQADIQDELQEWQYTNITANAFTKDDIPEYVPPEPPSDDNPTTSGGDDHLPRRGFSIGGTGGFVTQYALSYSQLHEFANMLWAQFGDADFISNIGTTFLNDYSIKPSDILNYIVSMRVYPFNLADSVSYTDTQSNNIFIGRGVFPYILTTGNTHVIADTCETFDGGYCDVPNYYNDFRDYEPASSIEVYVPYCGSVSISPSEVVGKRLRLTYGVDYSTGALSATLWVISDTNYTLAVLSGQVAASIQMSASNEMDGILRLTSIATTIGKAMLTEDKIDASKMSDTAKHVSNATNALGMASDLVNSVGSGLPVHSIGNTNGFSNFATPPRACITISYHKYKNPQNFAHVYGYKCNRRETLGSLNGYTKCKNVDVSGFTCHEDERTEIKALLESGVYL